MTDENQESTETENQGGEEQAVTFNQEQVDKIVADRLKRERKKIESKYSGVDVEAYKQWQQDKEASELEAQKQRGEFDNILKSTVEKKDAEISQLRNQIQKREVDGALLTAASTNGAVAPDQVSSLLSSQVRLNGEGVAEVVDTNGNPRYSETGDLMKPSDLVAEFLTANPHFVKASVGGTGSTGNAGGSTPKQKSVADMTMDEYREHRKSVGRGAVGKAFVTPS
jgi:hypothetical protein